MLHNNFIYDNSIYNWYSTCKYIFMAPIAILRFILICVCVFTANSILKYKPSFYKKVSYISATILIFLFGFRYTIKNKKYIHEAIKNKAIVIYNHVSIVDTFFLLLLYPFSIVINSFHGKIIKYVVLASNGIIIDKSKNEHSKKIIEHIQLKKPLLLIAPEGTTTNGLQIAQFKLGSFIPLQPIQPVMLNYKYTYFNPFYGDDNVCIVLYRMLTQIYNTVFIEFLPLEYPLQNETPNEFAERIHGIMSNNLHKNIKFLY